MSLGRHVTKRLQFKEINGKLKRCLKLRKCTPIRLERKLGVSKTMNSVPV